MVEHTVLVFSHNHGRFIAGCVESLLDQTVPPHEIIVYDAGSADGSIDILRHYETRIRLIVRHGEHIPGKAVQAHALQTAFGYSRGSIIFLVEGCDRFKSAKIERYAEAFERRSDVSLVQAPLEWIGEDGCGQGVLLEPRYHITHHLREIHRHHDVNLFYPLSALAFRRYYVEHVLPFELEDGLPLWTDTRLCIPAACFGQIATLPDPLTDYRQRENPADTSEIRLIRETLLRTEIFNRFCRRHGLRPISPWRNRQLYGQLLRVMTPRAATSLFHRARETHPPAS